MDSAVARAWFSGDAAPQRGGLLRTGIVSVALSGAVFAGAAFAVYALLGGPELGAAALAFGAIPLLNAFSVARLAFLLPRRRSLYLAAAVIHAVVAVSCAVTLVLAGQGEAGYFAGLAFGSLVALSFALGLGVVERPGRWLLRDELPSLVRFGLPLVPAAAAAWALFAIDRALVAALRGFDDAGLYGLGAKVTAPLMLLTSAFAVAWGPFILGSPEERRTELRARALTAVLAAVGAALVLVVLFAPNLVQLLGGDRFADASDAVPGVALGWLGWAAATILATEFSVRRMTWPVAVATTVTAAVNVLLNLLVIPRYGFEGAAWVTGGSFFLLAGILMVWERRLERPPYRLGRLAIVGAVIAAAMLGLTADDLARRLVVGSVAVAALLAVAMSDREKPPEVPS